MFQSVAHTISAPPATAQVPGLSLCTSQVHTGFRAVLDHQQRGGLDRRNVTDTARKAEVRHADLNRA